MLLAKPPTAQRLFALAALSIAALVAPSMAPGDARAEWWHNRQPVVTGPAATLVRSGPLFISAIDGKEHRRVDGAQFKIPAGRRRIDLCVWAQWEKDDGSPHHLPLCRQEVDRKRHRSPVLLQTGGPFPNKDRLFRKGLRVMPRQVVFDFVPNQVYRITAELLDKPWSFRDDGWRVRLQRQYKATDGRTKWETLYGTVRIPAMAEAYPPHSRREQPLPSGWRPFPPRPKNPYAMMNADGSALGADGTLEGMDGALDFNGRPRLAPGPAPNPAADPVPGSGSAAGSTGPSGKTAAGLSPAPPAFSRKPDLAAIGTPYWLRPPPRYTDRLPDRGTPPPARRRPMLGFGADGMVYADGSPLGADGTLTEVTVALAPETLAETMLIFYDASAGAGGGANGGDGRRYTDGSALGADGTLEGMAEALVFARLPEEKTPDMATALPEPPSQPARPNPIPARPNPIMEPALPELPAQATPPNPLIQPASPAAVSPEPKTEQTGAGQRAKDSPLLAPSTVAKAPAAVTAPQPVQPAKAGGAPAPEGGFGTVEKEIELPAGTAEPETPANKTGAEAEIVTTVETAEPDTPITPGIEIPPRPEMAEEQTPEKTAETAGAPILPRQDGNHSSQPPLPNPPPRGGRE